MSYFIDIIEITVERLQEASEPLSGSFVIAARGNGYDSVTTPIRHDASRNEVYSLHMKQQSLQTTAKIIRITCSNPSVFSHVSL